MLLPHVLNMEVQGQLEIIHLKQWSTENDCMIGLCTLLTAMAIFCPQTAAWSVFSHRSELL